MIDEFFHFVMYNDINHVVTETISSICWLIIDTIFFLLGHEWGKVCIYFIHIWFFAPSFDCFSESSVCMHVVVEKVKKFTFIYYLIAFFCEVVSAIEWLKGLAIGVGGFQHAFMRFKLAMSLKEVMIM